MTLRVRAGAQAPETLRLEVSNPPLASDPLDLSTVTAASFEVLAPNGRRYTWPASVESQTSALLSLLHEFEYVDVEQPGPYQIEVLLTVPAGTRRAGPTVLESTS